MAVKKIFEGTIAEAKITVTVQESGFENIYKVTLTDGKKEVTIVADQETMLELAEFIKNQGL